MYSTLPETSHASLRSMIGIEARRYARHPLFLLGAIATYAVTALVITRGEQAYDVMIGAVIPAFFIGVFGIVVAARLVRSTEASDEAMAALPGTEARRTMAVAGACLVPFAAGLVWLAEIVVVATARGVHENEWWFGTMNDLYVWSILIALGPIACLGGPLLGVLVGRWLRFRGASAVAVVTVLFTDIAAHGGVAGSVWASYSDSGEFRLWLPWAMFHTGNWGPDVTAADAAIGIGPGTTPMLPGNPAFYLLYVLALCVLAVGGAVWHDKTARTRRLVMVNCSIVAAAAVFLALAVFTGPDAMQVSDPIPWLAK